MKILARKYPVCKSIIYSRARHDFRWCSCGAIAVDGGFDYYKFAWKDDIVNICDVKDVEIDICVTKDQLYKDWASGKDEFGLFFEPENE